MNKTDHYYHIIVEDTCLCRKHICVKGRDEEEARTVASALFDYACWNAYQASEVHMEGLRKVMTIASVDDGQVTKTLNSPTRLNGGYEWEE